LPLVWSQFYGEETSPHCAAATAIASTTIDSNIITSICLNSCLVNNLTFHQPRIARLISALVLPIHTGFAIAGYQQFHLPFSIFIIVGTFLLSILQVVLTYRTRLEFGVT
jgi:hypothetical protein